MTASQRLIPIVIVGARGRMGQALIQAVVESDDMVLAAAVDRSDSPGIGRDAGELAGLTQIGLRVTDDLNPKRGQVVVDFSLPEATLSNLERCVEAGTPLVLGTTGISEDARTALRRAADSIAIVDAPNYSVGLTVLSHLAELATRSLGTNWDTEIFELHHRHKRDAPSGSALRLGQSIARASERELQAHLVQGRAGLHSARKNDEIGVASARGGDSVGEHTVFFFGRGERIELTHRASDRALFARGALRAARWVASRPSGIYDMHDVLGLEHGPAEDDAEPKQ